MIRVTEQTNATVLRLESGYASLSEDALEELGSILLIKANVAEPPVIVLDCEEMGMMGSRCIELFVRAWKRLSGRGGRLLFCNLQPFCRDVLRVVRLDGLWEIYPSLEAALSAADRAS
ncbi:MAG: STAS domain-containing protein [Planctomycetota bacterium]